MPNTVTSNLRAELKGVLTCSVSQTLAISDLSSLLLVEPVDARKLERAAARLARAANDTRAMAQNLFAAAKDMQRRDEPSAQGDGQAGESAKRIAS